MSKVKRFYAPGLDCLYRSDVDAPRQLIALVLGSDYDALAAEAQALREEVAALRARVVVIPALRDVSASADPEYRSSATGYNLACGDMARLNGLTVSEGLLRRLLDSDGIDGIFDAQQNYAAHQELRALLSEQDGGKP